MKRKSEKRENIQQPHSENWSFTSKWHFGSEEFSQGPLDLNLPYELKQSIEHTPYLKLDANNLAKNSYSDELTPAMQSDGTGLATILDYIRGESLHDYQMVEEMLCRIVPTVYGIKVKRAKVRKRRETNDGNGITTVYEDVLVGEQILFNVKGGEDIPAHAMSEGTLLALGLLAILMSPKQPNLILLDDIEQGLHPKAQVEFVSILKEILALKPNLQIIFTTHSPYILDELEPSQVHVLHLDEDGYTVAKRLDEHKNAGWASEVFTTGEIWDAEGEAWVLEQDVSEEEQEKEVVHA